MTIEAQLSNQRIFCTKIGQVKYRDRQNNNIIIINYSTINTLILLCTRVHYYETAFNTKTNFSPAAACLIV